MRKLHYSPLHYTCVYFPCWNEIEMGKEIRPPGEWNGICFCSQECYTLWMLTQ
jgi:hypothetical protein